MDIKELKKIFGEIANKNGLESAFGIWFKESEDCIIILDLQRSNFGKYYQLMIKIYVQGIFDNKYSISKDLIQNGGNIFRGQPPQYKDIFNLAIAMDDNQRKQGMEELFTEFLISFINKGLHKQGLKELEAEEKLFLLPAVKAQL